MAQLPRSGAHTVSIGGAWPNYTFTFGGTPARIHKDGHIWLNPDAANFVFALEIATPGFVFQNNGTTDGSLAFFTSDQTGPKIKFNTFNTFTKPVLDTTFTKLKFGSKNSDDRIYYYTINLWDSKKRTLSKDPIIVNR